MSYRMLMLPLLALALVASAGCGSKGKADETGVEQKDAGEDGKQGDQEKDEAIPVEVAALVRGPIEQILRFSGYLEAERAVEVRSEAARRVVTLLVEEGDHVSRGQQLVRLEDDEQKTAVARAEGLVDQARREHDRKANLFEQRMVSEQEMTLAKHDLEQRTLSLEDARRQLSYTTVRAPFAGTITRRLVKVGDQVAPSQHLFDLVDFDSLVALVYVPEKDLQRVAARQTVRLVPPASPDLQFAGSVDRIAPVVDPKSGTVKITVAVPFASGLRPGMFLEVELVTAVEADALLVPKRALVPDGTQVAVWRLGADDVVERIWIETVLEDRDRVTVVNGLEPGDLVVIAGQAGLKVGAKVRRVGIDRAGS